MTETARTRCAFTLVELLVVVAIISVLAAMLLPTLEQSLAMAKRTACINNLKQQYDGLMQYLSDSQDRLPTPIVAFSNLGSGAYGECSSITTQGRLLGIPAGYTKLSPNAVFYRYGYWTEGILNCPSMDCRIQFLPAEGIATSAATISDVSPIVRGVVKPETQSLVYGYIHYDFRFNHATDDWLNPDTQPFSPRAMMMNRMADKALCWDQAASNADSGSGQPRPASIHYTSPFAGHDVTRRLKWAHDAGGNVLTGNGGVKWLANFQTGYGWPGKENVYNVYFLASLDAAIH